MEKKSDLKMFAYGILMSLLSLFEFFVPYRYGAVSFLLYAVTPLKFFICIYMAGHLENRIKQGEDLGKCRNSIRALSYVFLLDFAVNLIFTVPFPRSYEMPSYIFFVSISLVEFVLNTMVFLYYARAYDAGLEAFLWRLINLIIIGIVLYDFVASFSGLSILSDKWIRALILLFIVRELLKIWISLFNWNRNESENKSVE